MWCLMDLSYMYTCILIAPQAKLIGEERCTCSPELNLWVVVIFPKCAMYMYVIPEMLGRTQYPHCIDLPYLHTKI